MLILQHISGEYNKIKPKRQITTIYKWRWIREVVPNSW